MRIYKETGGQANTDLDYNLEDYKFICTLNLLE